MVRERSICRWEQLPGELLARLSAECEQIVEQPVQCRDERPIAFLIAAFFQLRIASRATPR